MSYQEKLSCRQKKCGKALTIPLKLVVKADKLVDIARCPKCHESYKLILPLKDKDQWLPLIGKSYFACDVCGTANEDNWQIVGGDVMLANAQRLKTITKCKQCGKLRAKILSKALWEGVVAQIKKPAELPPTHLKCPSCGAEVAEDAKVCPKCRIELKCDKCGASILPGAKFCAACGDIVEKIAEPVSGTPPKAILCPSCQEDNEPDSSFCSVCGQELVCDKCHKPIREGASFCSNCGDPVKKSNLSE